MYGMFFLSVEIAQNMPYIALYTIVVNKTFEQMTPLYKELLHLAKSNQQF